MRDTDLPLINFDTFEAVPASVLPARGNATARALAGADWVLRRKSDGRYLATASSGRMQVLLPQDWRRHAGRRSSADVLARLYEPNARSERAVLPLATVRQVLESLGIAAGYGHERDLPLVPEPARLAYAGRDRYQRPLWLTAAAAFAWQAMQVKATRAGIVLDAISGYRSHAYQRGIFLRKLARGIPLADILTVNAAPGFSEHHSGHALDIGAPGEPPAEESFETTPAFSWLGAHAFEFGFRLSYPRNNPHGIAYEPWHWCFHR